MAQHTSMVERRRPLRAVERGAPWRLSRCAAVATVGGGSLAASFDPVGLGILAPLAVALLVWSQARATTALRAFLAGIVGGGTFIAAHTWWLQDSIGTGAWVAITVTQSLWFGLAGAATRIVWPIRCGPVGVAACWTSIELARQAYPLGGFPWGRVGVTVLDTPFAGLLPYVGVTGAGFFVVLLGATVLRLLELPDRRHALGSMVVVVAGVAMTLSPVVVTSDGSLSVAVVQGDVPGEGNDVGAFGRQVTANHVTATVDLADRVARGDSEAPDLVVWPENSTTVDPLTDAMTRASIGRAVAAVGAPVLVGGIVDASDPARVLNQGIVWTSTGPQVDRYTKHHPVPFGEYIPFRSVLGGLSDRFDEIPRDMIAGRGTDPLDIGGIPVADAICFDIAYEDVVGPQVRAGARIAVVQTSNATFVGTTQVDQQFAITRARAAEVGRAVAVASTNGVTGLIAPDGSVVARSPKRTTSVLQADLPLSSAVTPAVRWNGPLRWLVVVMTVVAVGAAARAGADRRDGGILPGSVHRGRYAWDWRPL